MNKRISFLLIFCLLISLTFNFANATLMTIYSEDFESYSYDSVPTGWSVISGGTDWKIHNCDQGGLKTYRNDLAQEEDQISVCNRSDLWQGLSFKLDLYVDNYADKPQTKAEMLLFYQDTSNYVRLAMFREKIVINERINGVDHERGYWFYSGSGSPGGSGSNWTWSKQKWYTLKAELTVNYSSTSVKFSIWEGGNQKSECIGTISRYSSGKFGLNCWGTKTCFDGIEIKNESVINVAFGIQTTLPGIDAVGDIICGMLDPGTTTYNLGVTTLTFTGGNSTGTVKIVGEDTSAVYDFAGLSDNPTDNQYTLKMKTSATPGGEPSSNWADYTVYASTNIAQNLKSGQGNGSLYTLSAIKLAEFMSPGSEGTQATMTFSISE